MFVCAANTIKYDSCQHPWVFRFQKDARILYSKMCYSGCFHKPCRWAYLKLHIVSLSGLEHQWLRSSVTKGEPNRKSRGANEKVVLRLSWCNWGECPSTWSCDPDDSPPCCCLGCLATATYLVSRSRYGDASVCLNLAIFLLLLTHFIDRPSFTKLSSSSELRVPSLSVKTLKDISASPAIKEVSHKRNYYT